MKVGEALRLLRVRAGLTQRAASKLEGAPDYRTLSHWENGHKTPSFMLLETYLGLLGFDFGDLQQALDQVNGRSETRFDREIRKVNRRVAELEERIRQIEGPPQYPMRASDA